MTGPLVPEPPGWMDDAACVDLWELFDDETPAGVAAAKEVCAQCPVAQRCARFAVASDARFGVWAAHEIEEYKARPARLADLAAVAQVKLPTDRLGPDAKRIEHGTTRGYGQHMRLNTPVCMPCRFARREYDRERDRRLGIERGTTHHGMDTRRGCG